MQKTDTVMWEPGEGDEELDHMGTEDFLQSLRHPEVTGIEMIVPEFTRINLLV